MNVLGMLASVKQLVIEANSSLQTLLLILSWTSSWTSFWSSVKIKACYTSGFILSFRDCSSNVIKPLKIAAALFLWFQWKTIPQRTSLKHWEAVLGRVKCVHPHTDCRFFVTVHGRRQSTSSATSKYMSWNIHNKSYTSEGFLQQPLVPAL